MRFLVDECTGPSVARWLREQGYDVFSVYEQARGIDDTAIMEIATRENRIIITNDKEFGARVVREHRTSCGVLLLRLRDERTANKIRVIGQVLRDHGAQLQGNLIVASERRIRIVPLHRHPDENGAAE
jgi:predicted nuclease of predicted toxin-antitoxin system